jgi:hypothetical protein
VEGSLGRYVHFRVLNVLFCPFSEATPISRAAIEGRVGNYQSPERIDKWRSIISDANEFVMVAHDGPKV